MSISSLPFTIEDLVDSDHPSDVQLSPNGDWVAFVLGKHHKPDKDKAAEKSIHLIEVRTRALRRLTGSGTGTNTLPAWSPDSRHLAFISNRSTTDEMQLYVMDIHGGEAQALTDLRGCVDAPKWSPDGCWISFLYSGTLSKQKQPDPDPIVVDAAPVFNRVWLINTQTHDLKPVTPANCHVFEYAWSPDGTKLVVLIASHPNPAEGWYSAQLNVVILNTGEIVQVCVMEHQIGRLTWSPDSQSIAFVSGVMSDEGNISGEVYVVPATGGQARCLTPDTEHSITWIEWRDEGIVYGGRHIDSAVLFCVEPANGSQRLISKGSYAINGYGSQQVSIANGSFAALRSSFAEPANIYTGSLAGGEWEQLTDLQTINQELFPPLRVENKHWFHADGTPVHGFLVYPADYTSGKRYPLFAHVHGGPSWGYVPGYLMPWERLMAARGCLVLMPNPRGSWGRGHAYQSANVGDLGGGDWQDINAGIDALINEGLVDPDRLAIGGWSYGGYLVTWAVTQTDRFRCAIAGASITSYESNYGVVSNREWQTTMFGSNVYDDYELHRSRSPIAYANRVKTPTLLVHGERDPLAPVQQAIEFYTALKHFGVPTQLVIYPREPHGFQERAHQIDLYQRIVDWVDRYLFV
jgi:dipeptidyl aminopeptidase/acylaminoacyl peptidase